MARRVEVPISVGELVDKLTILEIKSEKISEPSKRTNILSEFDALTRMLEPLLNEVPALALLKSELRAINEALWRIEDEIRDCERRGDFGRTFIDLARSVYRTNDRRAAVKRQIDEVMGSEFVEEKSYAPYDQSPR